MKKADWFLVILVLLVACAMLFLLPSESGENVMIYHDGALLYTLPLHTDTRLELDLPQGHNTVVIQGGKVYIESADCNGDCIRSGQKSQAGTSIVCLPHRLSIVIAGDDLDGVSG